MNLALLCCRVNEWKKYHAYNVCVLLAFSLFQLCRSTGCARFEVIDLSDRYNNVSSAVMGGYWMPAESTLYLLRSLTFPHDICLGKGTIVNEINEWVVLWQFCDLCCTASPWWEECQIKSYHRASGYLRGNQDKWQPMWPRCIDSEQGYRCHTV